MEKTLRSLALSRADKFPTDRFGIELLPGTFPDQGSPLSWWIRPWNARRSGLCCVDPEFSFLPTICPPRPEAKPSRTPARLGFEHRRRHSTKRRRRRRESGGEIQLVRRSQQAKRTRSDPNRGAKPRPHEVHDIVVEELNFPAALAAGRGANGGHPQAIAQAWLAGKHAHVPCARIRIVGNRQAIRIQNRIRRREPPFMRRAYTRFATVSGIRITL